MFQMYVADANLCSIVAASCLMSNVRRVHIEDAQLTRGAQQCPQAHDTVAELEVRALRNSKASVSTLS